ncbi:MAG: hypothetical protein RL571_679 [Pseudomonadota bacterium]|jgi:hypothetical protein
MDALSLGQALFGKSVFIHAYQMASACLMLELLGKHAARFN